jgi:glycosyltransferase involved in cell wall biosynthesis
MKILFLSRRFSPDIGGVEKHVLQLNKVLIKKGHTVTVIAEVSSNDTAAVKRGDKMKIEGADVYKINGGKNNWFKKFRIWFEMWQLRNLIRETDVVHCHDVFFWYLPFRFLFPEKPVYMTFHGYESFPISKKAILVRKLSEKLTWGNICIGDFIKKWYGTKPTFVSYGAVNLPKNVSHKEVKNESALFIGRLDDQTGILTYADAAEKVKKKIPNFELFVLGDVEYKNLLKGKAKLGGFQNNPERYFTTYHFAFVSRYLAILEAMAAKRLVFAVYDNPVKEDYLKMAPYAKNIIITNSSEALQKKIMFYLQNPKEEKKLVDSAYSWVKEQSWERMGHIYLSLWKSK